MSHSHGGKGGREGLQVTQRSRQHWPTLIELSRVPGTEPSILFGSTLLSDGPLPHWAGMGGGEGGSGARGRRGPSSWPRGAVRQTAMAVALGRALAMRQALGEHLCGNSWTTDVLRGGSWPPPALSGKQSSHKRPAREGLPLFRATQGSGSLDFSPSLSRCASVPPWSFVF